MAGNDDTPNGRKTPKRADPAASRERARARPVAASVATRLANVLRHLPPHCPYRPVGFEGGSYFVIDSNHQLRSLRPSELTRAELVSVCGREWLCESYPRLRKGNPVNGFAVDEAADALMLACHQMGYFSAGTRIRGRGAWRGEDGDLILHRGDHLIVGRQTLAPGQHDDFVYPRRSSLLPMAAQPEQAGPDSAANELQSRLDTFAWSRGTLDSQLMLGWLGAAMIGGALDFRPHIFITGEAATGKSTLQKLVSAVMGPEGMISVSDTSAAGLWQAFGPDTLPAGLDELESDDDPRKLRELRRLFRQATGGGQVLRGGADHHGTRFTIASAFCCSAIIAPPMASEELGRFHQFDLLLSPPGTLIPPFSTDMLDVIGQRLLRRLVDHHRRLVNEVLPTFKTVLVKRSFPHRTAELYGTLFACADVLLHDEMNLDEFERWCDHRFMMDILANVIADQTPEWVRCYGFLASSRIDPHRSDGETIGELIYQVAISLRRSRQQGELLKRSDDYVSDDIAAKAKERLASIGLRVFWHKAERGLPAGAWLYISNTHQGLAAVFRDTRWQTTANAASGGGWNQAMGRAPGATSRQTSMRFAGFPSRVLMVPLDGLMPDEGHADMPGDGEQRPAALN